MWVNRPFRDYYKITSPFGERIHPITKLAKMHKGVDLSMPEGTYLFAPTRGMLTAHIDKRGLGGGFGRYCILEGATEQGTRIRFIFAHLSEVTDEGRVLKGALIALSGNSGSSTGPHLHLQLEMHKGNYGWIPANPELSIDFEGTEK